MRMEEIFPEANDDLQLSVWDSEGGNMEGPQGNIQIDDSELALQDIFGPKNTCFGCGPSNDSGLQVKSFPKGSSCVAVWQPKTKYEAFPNILCGGIIGTLLDCHANWTAAWHLYKQSNSKKFPYTVTAEFSVKLFKPTSSLDPVFMTANVSGSSNRSVDVKAKILSRGETTVAFVGKFVAVEKGHPAYGRW